LFYFFCLFGDFFGLISIIKVTKPFIIKSPEFFLFIFFWAIERTEIIKTIRMKKTKDLEISVRSMAQKKINKKNSGLLMMKGLVTLMILIKPKKSPKRQKK
jgi:hypothetical protein